VGLCDQICIEVFGSLSTRRMHKDHKEVTLFVKIDP
jgi:hypothetical protein